MKSDLKVLILPGGSGRNDAHWYTWLRRELKRRGVRTQVCAQNLVSPLHRAQQLKGRFSLNANTILVGHSFGGLTALKWIELVGQPIAGLVLVDVSVKRSFESIPQRLLDEAGTAAKRRNIRRIQQRYLESWNWKVDVLRVRQLIKTGVVLSENRTAELFPDWRPEHQKLATLLHVQLITANGVERHFTAKREPKVLLAIQQLLSR